MYTYIKIKICSNELPYWGSHNKTYEVCMILKKKKKQKKIHLIVWIIREKNNNSVLIFQSIKEWNPFDITS